MQAGFAKIDITPPMGTRMYGWGLRDDDPKGAQGVHDRLYVRALWLSDKGEDVLIIGFDLLFFSREIADRYRGALGRATGLAPRQILLNTSHTHDGPTTGTWWKSGFIPPDVLYLDSLEKSILRIAKMASDAQKEVTIWAGESKTDMAVSRRKKAADGSVSWVANTDNTIYDFVPVCLLKDVQGEPVCLLFSASCHPSVVFGFDISADYPGVAMDAIDDRLGQECSLFLQGVAGDTKVKSCDKEMEFGTTWEDMIAGGMSLAGAVMDAVGSGLREVIPDLKAGETQVELLMEQIPSADGFREIRDTVNAEDRKQGMKSMLAERFLEKIERGDEIPQFMSVSTHGVQLGRGLRIIALEGEVVADHGFLIRDAFGTGTTFPLGYSDGCQAYIASDRMLDEGGYEVRSYFEYHFPARLASGIEKAILDGVDRLKDGGIG